MRRLTAIIDQHGGTTLADYAWTYDQASRVMGIASQTNPDDNTNGASGITYDATDQLTGVDYSSQSDESYAYDANGNRTSPGYSTGTGNQLASDGTYHYLYDGEGNRTFRFVSADGVLNAGDTDITQYAWDNRNRLTKVGTYTSYADYLAGTTSSTVEYSYDYLDRRILEEAGCRWFRPRRARLRLQRLPGRQRGLGDSRRQRTGATIGTGENAPHVGPPLPLRSSGR